MMRRFVSVAASLVVLCAAVTAVAKEKKPKPGPMTGTWECVSHGSSQGDMPFTLYLEQNGETVTGSVSSPLGGTDLTSATFKKKTLDIRIETPQGDYVLSALLKKGKLTGTWQHDPEKGTWEGAKKAAQATTQ